MKKFFIMTAILCAAVCFFSGCNKSVDYLEYVSEKRTDIYLYSNDGLEIKIYLSEKETPYSADGVKGNMTGLCEVYVTLPQNYDEVNVSVGSLNGEMSYRAVENCYYLSASDAGISGDSVEVTLTCGEDSTAYSAVNVRYGGVLSCEEAVKCVIDHAGDLFSSMTQNDVFAGEIYVRLLYDEGCYYYVGVCDRNKKINAFLVDGEHGKIIATKELNG